MSEGIKRRDFLRKLGISVPAVPLILHSTGSADEVQAAEKPKGASNCGPTKPAAAGPFYVTNTAETVNLNFRKMSGPAMAVMGTVYGGENGKTPLANARVEIWHCDDRGAYHPEGNGDISDYTPEQINLRGYAMTNEHGQFSFISIRPGVYGARRRHIHWRITADNHRQLTTQSYWLSERGTRAAENDFVDRDVDDCRYVDFEDRGNEGIAGVFDIVMQPA